MLRFERDVLIADLAERTIEGVIVPFDEVGTIAGRDYRFRRGSIELGSRVPLLVDHDRGHPIGVLAELVDQPTGVLARFKIDETPAGDEALVQAASGSRGALSIGAEVIRSRLARDGVVDVEASAVAEVSLLALGAFNGASVTRVAAEQDPPAEPLEPAEPIETDPEQPELEPEPDPTPAPPADPEEGEPMEAAHAAPVIRAERSPSPRELRAGELVRFIIEAQHGNREAARYLEAALTESDHTDVSGLLPPTFERTVIGGKTTLRPLFDAFASRPLPGVGLMVSKPKWTTRPDGAWAADVSADATSSPVAIDTQTADVLRWDWAGAIPWVVVQRSDPSVVDAIYAEAVQDFYVDVEAKIAGELLAGAPGTATKLGSAIAEFFTASGNQRAPELIVMAPDVWGDFADVGALSVPIAQGGVGVLTTTFAGIPAVSSGALPAGTVILATRRAVDARVTDPVRLTANAIGALNVELAVVGEGLFDTDYPAELLHFAGTITPTGTGGGAARSAKSS